MSTRLRSIDQAAVAPLSSRPSLSTPWAVCAAFCGAAALAVGCMLGDPPARAGHHEAAETSEGANRALLVHRDGDSGKCGLFQKGQVPVVADCTSWIKKVET